jgi:hypothetical protein
MRIQESSARLGLKFAAALRAIGEDLAAECLLSLEIGVEHGVYIVRGTRAVKPGDAKSAQFERRYTVDDVAGLDRRGREQQTSAVRTPDSGVLAEALRIAGGVVDEKHGRLVRLVKEERKIVFEYVDASGERRREERFGITMHQSQQEAVAARSGKDIWTNNYKK